MAWPSEAGAIASAFGRVLPTEPGRPSLVVSPATWRGRHYGNLRGKYRIMNDAVYRFYRSSSAPPNEDDTAFDTNASLPHTPTDTYGNFTWWVSADYFNGCLSSGFLPLGDADETYLRLDISGGAEVDSPPQGPIDWRLEQRAGGVVRVLATYCETGSLRATDWAIAYTFDGSTPATSTPDYTETMPTVGMAVLAYDLAAQSHGTTVKVRVQTRRSTTYSEDSTVETTTADATGPGAPDMIDPWRGRLPGEL